MIVRIVRMHFNPEKVDEFLEIFERTREAIANAHGCSHLELFRDATHSDIFVTISHWNTLGDLEAYRSSELFKNVWRRVKPLFNRAPETFSLEKARS